MLHPELPASGLEAVGRETGTAVSEHMGDLKREGHHCLRQEGHRRGGRLIILDGQVDETAGTINRHKQVPLAALAILGAELRQVLYVHVHETKVVVSEGSVRLAGAACRRQAA